MESVTAPLTKKAYEACVNPDHLHIGTPRDNVYDQIERGTLKPRNGKCRPIEFYRSLPRGTV